MNFLKIQGTHAINGGKIFILNVDYYLQLTPSKTNNPKAPKLQLVYKRKGDPFDNTRLSGLFSVKGKQDYYRGDIVRNGKKTKFTLVIDRLINTVTIAR